MDVGTGSWLSSRHLRIPGFWSLKRVSSLSIQGNPGVLEDRLDFSVRRGATEVWDLYFLFFMERWLEEEGRDHIARSGIRQWRTIAH